MYLPNDLCADDEFEFYLEFNPNYEINNTQFLTSLGNGVMDDSVYTHLVEQVEIMDMNGYSSTTESIIGIEDFKNLEYIELYAGPIKSIDFSQNRNLRFVHMGSDSLTSLLMNDSVYVLNLNSSNLDSLSLIQCSNLSTLSIYGNNSLKHLNLKNGNNYNLGISINSCPNLYCVDVDDPVYSTANWTNIDSWTNFSSNCATAAFGCTDSLAMNYDPNIVIDDNSCTYQMTYVPDDNFEQNMESQGWGNGIIDDSVYTHKINAVTYYDFDNGWWTNGAVVSNTTGFETFY